MFIYRRVQAATPTYMQLPRHTARAPHEPGLCDFLSWTELQLRCADRAWAVRCLHGIETDDFSLTVANNFRSGRPLTVLQTSKRPRSEWWRMPTGIRERVDTFRCGHEVAQYLYVKVHRHLCLMQYISVHNSAYLWHAQINRRQEFLLNQTPTWFWERINWFEN